MLMYQQSNVLASVKVVYIQCDLYIVCKTNTQSLFKPDEGNRVNGLFPVSCTLGHDTILDREFPINSKENLVFNSNHFNIFFPLKVLLVEMVHRLKGKGLLIIKPKVMFALIDKEFVYIPYIK